MPKSAHAFFQLLCWRKGPLFKGDILIRSLEQERDHYPWVVEQIRILAPEFFRQFCRAEDAGGSGRKGFTFQADAFVAVVTEKMFALSVVACMPQLLVRQRLLDASGSPAHRWRLCSSRPSPPPRKLSLAEAPDQR